MATRQISKRDKTSLVIDREKVAEAREILGTKTLAETVDAALDEVIALAARRRIMDRIRRDGGIGPTPAELRRLREPREVPVGDRPLRPGCRAADLGRRAGRDRHVRANHEVRIEDGEQTFEVAAT